MEVLPLGSQRAALGDSLFIGVFPNKRLMSYNLQIVGDKLQLG